jgi:hypothetical protein
MPALHSIVPRLSPRWGVPAIAVTAVAVLVGGVTTAAFSLSSGTVHTCYSRSSGHLRVLTKSHHTCTKHEHALAIDIRGPRGEPGPRGTPGPSGAGGLSHAYVVTQNANVDVGKSAMPVVSLALPAGSWVITGKVSLSVGNTTAISHNHCELLDSNSNQLDDSILDLPATNADNNHSASGTIPLVTTRTFGDARTLSIECFGGTATAFGAVITAEQVETVN